MSGPLIHIGTSGWSYRHWKGTFYPEKIRSDQFLAYYAQRFSTVEINNTFYRLPDQKTLRRWREAVPASFRFAVKASRYITHVTKLTKPTRSLRSFLDRVGTLGPALGPVLFQLPPKWRFNAGRLESFLKMLGRKPRAAFEFRDPTWFREETYELLNRHGAAFCIYNFARTHSPRVLTADFVYVRLHGPDGAYRGQYGPLELHRWAKAFSTWAAQGRTVYCYFDNDERGYAPQDALRLRGMLMQSDGL